MGNTTCEASHRLHFLTLTQSVFSFLQFRRAFGYTGFERLVQFAELFFNPLAFGDIDGCANYPGAIPISVEQAAAFGGNPTDNAVFLADRPIFNVIERARFRIARVFIGLTSCYLVIGMEGMAQVARWGNYCGRPLVARK